ncbi:MAG: hypothetical protein M1818_000352 [Claussenomyces sp. TS43310]|nr:MAG: hypothetical protein M1818_000352 [Claussenomyces sp. TS43310]
MATFNTRGSLVALLIAASSTLSLAHEHHEDEIPEGEGISAEPIDAILWIHILMQMFTFGIIFPTGMVLGIVKNRWHVPVQVAGTALAIVGYFLGHMHKGRQFGPTAHASFANWLMLMLLVQVGLGIFLRLHLTKGFYGKVRRFVVIGHGVLGKAMPVVSWVQMIFGGIASLGYCRGDHLGQCLAHFIMGSAFIGYAIIMTIMLLVGQAWLRRTGRSQEFFDSVVIAAWGCVNTFTEHRWGKAWVENDIEHTTMGVIWWCAGLTGVWLSRRQDGGPKRNFIPGMVIAITGWGMSAHPQHVPLSSMIHTVFGYTLMAAGFARIIEISFVLRDQATASDDGEPNSFQYLPPFFLYAAGFLFLSATEEQMKFVSEAGVTHVGYVLVIYSFAFILFLFTNMLLHLYSVNVAPPTPPKDTEQATRLPRMNGHRPTDSRQIRDAEEFELEGLMSDDEGPESPSTLGRNNHKTVE